MTAAALKPRHVMPFQLTMNHRTRHVVGYLRAYYAGRRQSVPAPGPLRADALELVPDLSGAELASVVAAMRVDLS